MLCELVLLVNAVGFLFILAVCFMFRNELCSITKLASNLIQMQCKNNPSQTLTPASLISNLSREGLPPSSSPNECNESDHSSDPQSGKRKPIKFEKNKIK